MLNKTKKRILIGYRNKEVGLYRTPLKPLGYVVAGLGLVSFGVAVIPDALLLMLSPKMFIVGLIAYPLSFALLGLVGIRFSVKKKITDKIRLIKYKRGWL